jgi:hypothetical protein
MLEAIAFHLYPGKKYDFCQKKQYLKQSHQLALIKSSLSGFDLLEKCFELFLELNLLFNQF